MAEARHTIVCLSSQRWDDATWTNKQHVMSRLAGHHHVVHVDFGVAPGGARAPFGAVVARAEGLDVAEAWTPDVVRRVDPRSSLADFFAFDAKVRVVQRFLSRERIRDPIVWVYHPGYADALERLPRKLLVYDCVDEYAEFPAYRADPGWLVERERRLCARADVVLTTSGPLFERKSRLAPGATHLVENVGDVEHFAKAMAPGWRAPRNLRRLSGPIIGFVGAVSGYKLELDWLAHIARRRPTWKVVLIGPIGVGDAATDVSELAALPNVHLLGTPPYSELPRFCSAFDVAVIPYRNNGYTRTCFPIKFFEMLATGKPVVISRLPALEQHYAHVGVADGPDEFLARCEEALASPDRGREGRVALARANSWPHRVAAAMSLVEAALDARRTGSARAAGPAAPSAAAAPPTLPDPADPAVARMDVGRRAPPHQPAGGARGARATRAADPRARSSSADGQPLITIGITCFRDGEWLRECWESVLAQTDDRWVAALVMDGSDHAATRAVFDALDHPKLSKLALPENRGPYPARNVAFELTRTPYHFYLDGDDQLVPGAVAAVLSTFARHPEAGFVYGDYELIGTQSGVRRHGREVAWDEFLDEQPIPGPCAYSKALWERLGGFATELARGNGDYDFFLGAAEAGVGGRHCGEIFYRYRVGHPWKVSASYARSLHETYEVMVRRHPRFFAGGGRRGRFLASGYRKAALACAAAGDHRRAATLARTALMHGAVRDSELWSMVAAGLVDRALSVWDHRSVAAIRPTAAADRSDRSSSRPSPAKT